jgi:hypothetical protein
MMLDHTPEEAKELTALGFHAAYMMDVEVGDIVSIAPVTRFSFDDEDEKRPRLYAISRRIRGRARRSVQQNYDDDGCETGTYQVMHFIAHDESDAEVHLDYGSVYPCFIRR